MNVGEVWFVNFPIEEDPTQFLKRPVVVLDVDTLEVLSVKVTKTAPRSNDPFDTPIVYWQAAMLRFQSTARVAKTVYLPKTMFVHKIGDLHPDDIRDIIDNFQKYIS